MTAEPSGTTDRPLETLRARSSLWIGVVALALVIILVGNAVLAVGAADGLRRFGPVMLLIAALLVVVMILPGVRVFTDRMEVRNILHTYRIPYSAVDRVRIGSMLKIDAVDARGENRTVTAWSAPAIRKQGLLDAFSRTSSKKPPTAPMGQTSSAQLLAEQKASAAWPLKERVDGYQDHHLVDGELTGAMQVRLNGISIAVLAASVGLIALQALV
ncbi:hypothetical protein [Helcobacillus massiliensis]|uniref:hypothetical protein n=1 Tax=Helcobacillus massiliensis TaxID=521392 RepID=UPI00255663DD|nr:hypothetical protein [Helcobacillus massiliensis]MDK7741463.1 hypothetical protein [Helcobacillus massiliensis]WOO92415.1 hypothetical protein R3I40_08320 [Helcobacillus massiliensis]